MAQINVEEQFEDGGQGDDVGRSPSDHGGDTHQGCNRCTAFAESEPVHLTQGCDLEFSQNRTKENGHENKCQTGCPRIRNSGDDVSGVCGSGSTHQNSPTPVGCENGSANHQRAYAFVCDQIVFGTFICALSLDKVSDGDHRHHIYNNNDHDKIVDKELGCLF